jgi:hypothetical protein
VVTLILITRLATAMCLPFKSVVVNIMSLLSSSVLTLVTVVILVVEVNHEMDPKLFDDETKEQVYGRILIYSMLMLVFAAMGLKLVLIGVSIIARYRKW